MNSWLNPHFFFFLLNIMIATIAFTSTFTNRHHHHHQNQQTQNPPQDEQIQQQSSSIPTPLQDSFTQTTHNQDPSPKIPKPNPHPISQETHFEPSLKLLQVLPDTPVTAVRPEMRKSVSMKTETGYIKEEEVDDFIIESRRPATMRERRRGDMKEGVDAEADDFINRFKKQLMLQRMDSINKQRERVRM
ncbi:pathogen-associated molecular patterns-induced protein A70-like [Impatiens glandulifera]|uniref:pathogen-associated molecular patterns-induced protein A70-like n=1 Tax=Impatiens glandulifera TaxID=253017 RepID=UPI001FB108C0|nr:pathogen-associated molecular patterns-induced protein A70-like [Impatiens glandulifera]